MLGSLFLVADIATSHSVVSEEASTMGAGRKIPRKRIEVRRLHLDLETPASHDGSSIHPALVKSDAKEPADRFE